MSHIRTEFHVAVNVIVMIQRVLECPAMLAQEMSKLWLMLEAVSSDTKIQNSLDWHEIVSLKNREQYRFFKVIPSHFSNIIP